MIRSSEQLKTIMAFREKKVKEFKRPISLSEAISLWVNESFKSRNNQAPRDAYI